jgi:hypothetical protein
VCIGRDVVDGDATVLWDCDVMLCLVYDGLYGAGTRHCLRCCNATMTLVFGQLLDSHVWIVILVFKRLKHHCLPIVYCTKQYYTQNRNDPDKLDKLLTAP